LLLECRGMSEHDLFGSSSSEESGDEKVEELPSTQAHLNELFGDDDENSNVGESEDKQNDANQLDQDSSSSSSDDEAPINAPHPDTHDNSDQQKDIEPELNFSDVEDADDEVVKYEVENVDEEEKSPLKDSDLDSSASPKDNDSVASPKENNTDSIQKGSPKEDVDSGEEENLMEKALPTTQDLFGDDDLDVSSDDDDANEQQQRHSSNDEDGDTLGMRGDDDRPPTPEEKEEEGLSISIELPRCNMSLGKELNFIKLPNFLSVDTKPFDANLYEDEADDDEIQDEEGRARLKLKVENTIRWRYSKDKDGNEVKESNCRFVRWSDGSLSMHLGNEVFDVFKMPIHGEQNHLFVQQGTGLQAQAVFKDKLSFRPQSTASQTHRKMTMSIADRMAKAQQIKFMPATERDPESQRENSIKKEDERLRAQSRRESQQRRVREKNHLKGLSSSYLEQDMDDEEDFDDSLAAIKNKYKKDVQGARSKPFHDIYSDDSDGENKLQNAKLNFESDDEDIDDPEIRAKKEELAKKKKSSRKVIESDEDSESD